MSEQKQFTHGSLFSGIGGPEVAAAMLGIKNIFHCEINPFGRQILEYWFPDSVSYEDITKTDFTQWRGKVDILTGGFPCQPFSYAGKRGGKMMTVTSGQRCSALLKKQGPLGLLVRTLLESPLWSKEGYSLTWEARRLCSRKVTEFTDTNSDSPSPLNESAEISNTWDIQSSRCLYQLRLSELPIEETEYSSSPIMMPTPIAVEREHRKRVEELKEKKAKDMYSRQNGDSRPNGLMDYMRFTGLLKTPSAMDVISEGMKSKGVPGTSGTLAQEIQSGYVAKRGFLLPTPTAREGDKFTNTYNPDSQMGQSLSAMAGSGMLPTPSARDYQPPYNPDAMVRKNGMIRDDQLSALPTMLGLKERGGCPFRLSPLFTEEMMGFPFLWVALPFLNLSGEQKASRPTEMQ